MKIQLLFYKLCFAFAITTAMQCVSQTPVPSLGKFHGTTQLLVDGKPYLIVGGELHNSSASSSAYMQPIWPRLKALHLNTVIGTASWELTEPQEGHFDFSLVDAQLQNARANGMRMVLIWFGSYKNTSSGYLPLWVKEDKKRFFWAEQKTDPSPEYPRGLYAVSAFCTACRDADANAFSHLMQHLAEADPQHTVIMVQLENEMGILGWARDYATPANKAWQEEVPRQLMAYLLAHRQTLRPELKEVWSRNGFRTAGTWAEVFGSDAEAEEIFSAWHFAQYTNSIARTGKQRLPLPMYVNAWIVQNVAQKPGDYPSGGPVSRVMDIWRAGAPDVDLFAPDIYLADVDNVYASYAAGGNPLFFPESRAIAGNYLWAIGHYSAIGVSPFGVDDLREDDPLGDVYRELSNATSLITAAQAERRIAAIAPGTSGAAEADLAGFAIHAKYVATKVSNGTTVNGKSQTNPDVTLTQAALAGGKTGYALFIADGGDGFYVMGTNLTLSFDRPSSESNDYVLFALEEGHFQNDTWIPGRRLNGDEGPALRRISLPSHFTVLHVRVYRHPGPGSKG